MTTYSIVDESGETRLRGTIAPDPGGGSQTVKAVDLGIIDLAAVFASDPILLYAMQPGEYLSTIRFTDTDIEESVPTTAQSRMEVGIGTAKSFAWYTFAHVRDVFDGNDAFDTLSFASNSYAYGPAAVLEGGPTAPAAMVLSAAAAGDIYAGMFDRSLAGDGLGVRFKAPAAWAAQTAYGTEVTPTPGTPPLVKAAILANGTIWVNTGAAGTSGDVEPDFAGHAGGSVNDSGGGFNIPITAVNQGLKHFTVADNYAADLIAAGTFDVGGSTGNDGTYTVVTAAFAAGNTTVTVVEVIPDATADGVISVTVPDGPIVWTDTTDPPFTAGTVRAIAEIWAPA